MKYTRLGSSDLNVSRLCFGCWQLNPKFWGEVDIAGWEEAVRGALDVGINFIDTADAYGDGVAEEELGRFLHSAGLRDQFVIATKFFWNFSDGDTRFADTTHDYIIRACENSLRRLQTDHIDLYQIHSWDALTRPDEVARAFATLKAAGKVRWFGVSNLNPEQMDLYRDHFEINSLQPGYSLLDRRIEQRELPYCLRHGIGVINYSPLYRGLLGGRYTAGSKIEDGRAFGPFFHGEGLRIVAEAMEKAKVIAAELDLTMAQLALRWTLTHPAISSSIVGVKKPDHILGALKATEGPLSQEIWHKVGNLFSTAVAKVEALPD